LIVELFSYQYRMAEPEKGTEPYSSIGVENFAQPPKRLGPMNFLTLGFNKFRKNFTAGFKAGRFRNVDPTAMLNVARINQATKNLETLQVQLNHAKYAQAHKNQFNPEMYNRINSNVEVMSHTVESKIKALEKLRGDKNAAIQAAALKKLNTKIGVFDRFLNTLKKGGNKVKGVFTRRTNKSNNGNGRSATRKNVMAKASRALNSLQNMGGIAASISQIAKAIEDCCESDDKSVAPSNLGNNNGSNGGPDGNNGAPDGNTGGPGGNNGGNKNAGERINNFGQNVGSLFENAPNAPKDVKIARGNNGKAPNRINEYGQNVGNLFC
jgi:hypothetical protein